MLPFYPTNNAPFYAGETAQFVSSRAANKPIVNDLIDRGLDYGPLSVKEVLTGSFDTNTTIGMRVNFQTWVKENI